MKKTTSITLALLVLTILTLSGCILVPVDDGNYRGSHGRGHSNNHDDRGDRH